MERTDRDWRATFCREDGQRIDADWIDVDSHVLARIEGACHDELAEDGEIDKFIHTLQVQRHPYVDLREFGLLVVDKCVGTTPRGFIQLPNPRGKDCDVVNQVRTRVEFAGSKALEEELPWYFKLDRRRWPSHNGTGVAVGVFDSWLDCSLDAFKDRIAPGDLIRLVQGSETPHINDHGTLTCGVIGAKSINGQRVALVPECRLVVGEHGPNGIRSVTLVRLLIFLCLLANKGVRIACIPFGVDQAVYSGERCAPWLTALDRFFSLLRTKYQLVCFCAAGENGDSVLMPACVDACEAVFGYQESNAGSDRVSIRGELENLDSGGCPKGRKRIFLGPGDRVRSIDIDSGAISDSYGGSSAATAFVAGVAASVLGANPDLSADGLVLALIDDSETISEFTDVNCKFFRVRIP